MFQEGDGIIQFNAVLNTKDNGISFLFFFKIPEVNSIEASFLEETKMFKGGNMLHYKNKENYCNLF